MDFFSSEGFTRDAIYLSYVLAIPFEESVPDWDRFVVAAVVDHSSTKISSIRFESHVGLLSFRGPGKDDLGEWY